MATKRQSLTFKVTSNHPAVVSSNNGGSDGNLLPITGHKLNGHNYLQWSQYLMMSICGKVKDDHLTGAAVLPKKEDLKFKSWKSQNNMGISWLINSMINDIEENFLLYGTVKEYGMQLKRPTPAMKIH